MDLGVWVIGRGQWRSSVGYDAFGIGDDFGNGGILLQLGSREVVDSELEEYISLRVALRPAAKGVRGCRGKDRGLFKLHRLDWHARRKNHTVGGTRLRPSEGSTAANERDYRK